MASFCRAAAAVRAAARPPRSPATSPFQSAMNGVASLRLRRSFVAAARLWSCIAANSSCWSCLSKDFALPRERRQEKVTSSKQH
uniref:Uncharacterized protein n=1 Tax=Oryza punctata TaxID=4537 RepID=A0A0E0LQS6_ORYPU